MKSRVIHLLQLTAVAAVTIATLAGCGKTSTGTPPIGGQDPCFTSGNGYCTGGTGTTPASLVNVPTGSVTGKVLDVQTNLGLSGATVRITGVTAVQNAAGQVVNVMATTDAGGGFTLPSVPQGRQSLEVSKPDYTYLNSNGAVTVQVVAGAMATAPTLTLTPSRLVQANGFITAFSNFKKPRGIRMDQEGKNFYVTDVQGAGNLVWKDWAEVKQLNVTGGQVNSFGGISLKDLSLSSVSNIVHWIKSPNGVGVDAGGNVLVADSGHNEIKQYAAGGKFLKEVKGSFKQVFDIAVMPTGNIVVTDPVGGKVSLFTSGFGTIIDNLVTGPNSGSFMPTPGASSDPNLGAGLLSGGKFQGVAVDNGKNIYVVDAAGSAGMVVRKFDERGNPISFAGSPGFGTIGGSQAGHFENPTGIAVDNRNGDIYVVDSGNNRIQRFDAEGHYLDYFGGFGTASGMFSTPIGAAVDKDGNVYVTDFNNGRVQKFGPGRPANGF